MHMKLVFGDRTSGHETYGGGRFLWVDVRRGPSTFYVACARYRLTSLARWYLPFAIVIASPSILPRTRPSSTSTRPTSMCIDRACCLDSSLTRGIVLSCSRQPAVCLHAVRHVPVAIARESPQDSHRGRREGLRRPLTRTCHRRPTISGCSSQVVDLTLSLTCCREPTQ